MLNMMAAAAQLIGQTGVPDCGCPAGGSLVFFWGAEVQGCRAQVLRVSAGLGGGYCIRFWLPMPWWPPFSVCNFIKPHLHGRPKLSGVDVIHLP